MAKKKTQTAPDILGTYMKYVLENGERPKTMNAFVKALKIKEVELYDSFGSFDAIEKAIFEAFFNNTITVLHKNKEYSNFNPQNKLLSFYFTFFEVLKANRSYVLYALDPKKPAGVIRVLTGLRREFTQYVNTLEIETFEIPEPRIEKVKSKGLSEMVWGQLIFLMKFWMEDGSPGFEKTDILIEKSVSTGFALLDTSTLSSVFDLGKFLFQEKVMAH